MPEASTRGARPWHASVVMDQDGGAVLRSEVKEEELAGRPIPGDMNGAVRPAVLIPLRWGFYFTNATKVSR